MRIKMAGCAAGLAVAAWAGFAAETARGAITVDGRSSVSDTFTYVDSPQFFDYDEDADGLSSTSLTDPFTYNASALADEAFGGEAEANTEHASSLTYTGGSLSGVDVSGYVQVSVLASQGVESEAEALSGIIVLFTVPAGETADFSLTGNLGNFSNKTGLQVYLYDVERDTDIVFRSGNAGAFDETGTLQPGQYEFGASGFGLGSDLNQSFGEAQFDAHLTLSSPVPEPASLALLVAPAALLARRRRPR